MSHQFNCIKGHNRAQMFAIIAVDRSELEFNTRSMLQMIDVLEKYPLSNLGHSCIEKKQQPDPILNLLPAKTNENGGYLE